MNWDLIDNEEVRGVSLVLLLVAVVVTGVFEGRKLLQDQRDREVVQANDELESRRIAEIEAIKGRLREMDSKHELACTNAAGFHYPEETHERELARMRRIEICVSQLVKP